VVDRPGGVEALGVHPGDRVPLELLDVLLPGSATRLKRLPGRGWLTGISATPSARAQAGRSARTAFQMGGETPGASRTSSLSTQERPVPSIPVTTRRVA